MKHPPRNIAIDWINTIWTTDLTANSKLLACNLRRYMNSTNDMAWPSIGRIAGECNLSEQCVRKHLKILCAEGWLQQLGQSNSGTFKYQAQYPPAIIAPLQSFAPPPATIAPELNNRIKQDIIYKNFKPPTPNEVQEYSSTIDAERFCDFYESKGWLIGKNKMKCWKSAVRNWERNSKKSDKTGTTTRATSIEHDLTDKTWAGL
jgi:hypothetical protein